MDEIRTHSLAAAVGTALNNALREWRAEHAPKIAISDLLASELAGVDMDVHLRSGGRSTIIVLINAKRQADSETFFYRVSRAGNESTVRRQI
jgi:hypothetical protein